MTFADQQVQVAAAVTGEAALRAWHARPFTVVIADIAMQAPNGYAIAHEIRMHQEGRRTAVILLAAQTEVVDEVAVSRSRVSTVLRKPLDSHQLIDAVRDAVHLGPPPSPRAVVATNAVPEPVVDTAVVDPAVIAAATLQASPAPEAMAVATAAVDAEPAMFEAPVAAAEARHVQQLPEAVGEVTGSVMMAVADARRWAPALEESRVEAENEDVALLLGRDSFGLDEPPADPAPAAAVMPTGRRLADTFHAMLEVEQGAPVPVVPLPELGGTADFDAVAARIIAEWNGDSLRLARLEREIVDRASSDARAAVAASVAQDVPAMTATIVEQVVRELVPRLAEDLARRLVADAADRLVREEIARLRGTRAAE
jgi:DNA-binding response OmpR family regulator